MPGLSAGSRLELAGIGWSLWCTVLLLKGGLALVLRYFRFRELEREDLASSTGPGGIAMAQAHIPVSVPHAIPL